MLNGIAPILIFNFEKLTPDNQASVSSIPILSRVANFIKLPPIPLYLDEKLTGIYIDTQDKNIDVQTDTEASTDSSKKLKTTQRPLGSTVRITMTAKRDSIGIILLSALAEIILEKVTSKEYSVTYLNGATSIFGGLLHSFNVQETANTDVLSVTLELNKTTNETKKPDPIPEVQPVADATNLNNGIVPTTPPTKILTTPIKGPPASFQLPKQPPVKMGGSAGAGF